MTSGADESSDLRAVVRAIVETVRSIEIEASAATTLSGTDDEIIHRQEQALVEILRRCREVRTRFAR